MKKRLVLYFTPLFILSPAPSTANSDWSGSTEMKFFYTDYVGLFSVTNRLSLDEDPTQPIIDEPEKKSDFIYEPTATLTWRHDNLLGQQKISLEAGGLIFQQNSEYSHAFITLEAEQEITEDTLVKTIYQFLPALYLGPQDDPSNEHNPDAKTSERLDSHIWSIHLDHEFSQQFLLRGLIRYGIRLYEQPFSYRDTQFFTVGSHLEWTLSPYVEILAGYHFERGYTAHKKTKKFEDDIAYINHYASAELKITVNPKLHIMLIVDYEHNDYTSPYVNDIHFNGTENVYQGEIEVNYQLTATTKLVSGWQYGVRKFNFENHSDASNNLWVGMEMTF